MITINTTQIATDLDEAKTQVATHQTQIEQLQTKIGEHETALTGAQNRVKELTKELCKSLGVAYAVSKTKGGGTGKTRTFTPEAVQNIRAGQRKRWEKKRLENTRLSTVAAGETPAN